jgi:glycosyltransferase involved in cell wall biosynthesis
MNDLALITPVKNEYANIDNLKETVLSQTKVPDLWIIVVADSSDGTLEKCIKSFSNLNFVKIIKQKSYSSLHWNISFAIAINEAIEEIEKTGEFKYIAKIDASVKLNDDYFETLINELEKDKKLSFVCGKEIFLNMDKNAIPIQPSNDGIIGMNDNRVYRYSFLKEERGYPLTPCPDTVLIVKNIKKGRTNKVVETTKYVETRAGSSREGIWSGYFQWGRGMYILNYHPLLVLLNAGFFSLKFKPHYQGIALIFGYISSLINHDVKVDDDEIKNYFYKERFRELIQAW